MEIDEPKRECRERAEGQPGTFSAFWSSQLERIKELAERRVNRRISPSKQNGHLMLGSDGAHRS